MGTQIARHDHGRSRVALALACTAFVAGAAWRADAEAGAGLSAAFVSSVQPTSSVTSPSVAVEPGAANPGESVTLTIEGFKARTVTAAICGNEARRGSGDCDMVGSVGIVLDASGDATVSVIPVANPPSPCPCVVRVATADFQQVAVSPLKVIGHEIAEPVESAQQRGGIAAYIAVRRSAVGLADRLRSDLGGSVDYEVTVTVSNRTAVSLDDILIAGSFGPSEDQYLADLPLTPPTQLEPGQTWQQVVRATVPPRVIGELLWRVNASAGTRVDRATVVTEQHPTVLVGLLFVLVVDLGILAMRWRVRVRRRPPTSRTDDASAARRENASIA